MSNLHTAPVRGGSGRRPGAARRAFTLIEVLIVVFILGLLATIVIAQFSDANADAEESAVDMQLSRTRKQIQYYRAQIMSDPLLVDRQWEDMVVVNDYLQQAPINMLNGSTFVASAPGAGVGWVWRDTAGDGVFNLFATDATGMAEYVE